MGVGLGFGQQVGGVMGAGGAATAEDEITVSLKKIKTLYEQGLISQDEYEAKKKDIISKI